MPLIYLLVVLMIMVLGWWRLQQMPLPSPIAQIAEVVFVVICVIIMVAGWWGLQPSLRLR
jgi:uncharacterized membrane protein YwzB